MKYYSPTSKGFYDSTVNVNIPKDAVVIEGRQHEEFINKQDQGFISHFNVDHFEYSSNPYDSWDVNAMKWVPDIEKTKIALDTALAVKLGQIDFMTLTKVEEGFNSYALGDIHSYDCRRGLDATDLALAMEIATETNSSVDYMAKVAGGHFTDFAHTLSELRQVALDMRQHVQGHRVIARTKKLAATDSHNSNDITGVEAVSITNWTI